MNTRDFRLILGSLLVGCVSAIPLMGCGDSDDPVGGGGGFSDAGADSFTAPEDGIRIRGSVVESSGGMGAAFPIAGAEVRVSVDRNGDGELSPDEIVTSSTGYDGSFDLATSVEEGQTVVARFRAPGSATAFRTIVAAPNTDVEITISMVKLAELTCSGSRCSMAGNLLSIEGLDPGISGAAQIFNPVTQADRFPGGFHESTGKLLISGVFSSVELTDEVGDPVKELGEPAILRMNVPMDTWNIMTDIHPGTDRIEVPLYAFDEVLGTWVRDGEAYLEDGDGVIIPESDLASIRDGSYPGIVVSRGEVNHFSYWNVDWPVESHGCVSGRVVDESGNPMPGALVTARGITYTGASTPVTVGADGRFCITVMRSEGPGEDIDQNGVPGQTHSVSLRVVHGGKVYSGGVIDVAAEPATCEEGGCTDAGEIGLTPANQLQVALCTISGTVRDRMGTPVEGASVLGWDEAIESEVFLEICGTSFENCDLLGMTGEDGKYTIHVVMLDGITLYATKDYPVESGRQAVRQGQRSVAECPTEPVNITLDQGYDVVDLWVEVNGNQFSWEPNEPATMLSVMDEWEETSKWNVMSMEGGFTGPVTYGTAPPNTLASPNNPVPLVSGDLVTVMVIGTTPDGYRLYGNGEAWVP